MPELDSVRGLASFTVVLFHFHDMWLPDSSQGIAAWKISLLSLLRPFYAGTEAVTLFFVLSGLVLAMPYLRGRGQAYPRYLIRRILRIYGPYIAALALALCGAAIWHGHPYHGAWAAASWKDPINLPLVRQHILFLGVYDSREYDFVIWSLVQELRISIIFPFLFLVTKRIGAGKSMLLGFVLSGIALILAPAIPDITVPSYNLVITLHYIAFFIVGILLASHLGAVKSWWDRASSRTHWILAILSFAFYAYDLFFASRVIRLIQPGGSVRSTGGVILGNWVTCFGAVGLIIVALNARRASQFLTSRAVHFLGRISYSLYLVHGIVLLSLTYACGDRVSIWIQFPIYLASALLFAWLFCVVVEEPFIRWSRAV